MGRLRIDTAPATDVFIDGVETGVTPLTIEVAAGRHAIEVRPHDSDVHETIVVEVRSGQTLTRLLHLTEETRAISSW